MSEKIVNRLNKIESKLNMSCKLKSYEYAEIEMKLYLYKYELQKVLLEKVEKLREPSIISEYGSVDDEKVEDTLKRRDKIDGRLKKLAHNKMSIDVQYETFENRIRDIVAEAIIQIENEEKNEINRITEKYVEYLSNVDVK